MQRILFLMILLIMAAGGRQGQGRKARQYKPALKRGRNRAGDDRQSLVVAQGSQVRRD